MRNSKGRYLIVSLVVLVMVLAYFLFFGKSQSFSTHPQNFETSFVDRGKVFKAVEAIGVVEPENEVIILCPNSSIITKINKEPGTRVKKGEPIIELDEHQIRDEIDHISDQLEVKKNSLERSKLQGQMARIDLDYNVEVKKLKIISIKAQLADEEQLLSVGGISSAKLDETKQNLVLSEKDLDMVLKKNDISLRQMKTEEAGLYLQIGIEEKLLADKIEMLERMCIRAPSDGIILSISGKEGEKVGTDQNLVVLSDLTTFKIKGSIEEKFSDIIKTGNLVSILIENEKLAGTIGNVTPSVSNNKIQFNVHLEKDDYAELIPNQTVKLLVVETLRNNVLRIPALSRYKSNSEQSIYVIDSGRTVRRKVVFGMKGADYQEVVCGLSEGEEVVASDF
ncbi:MAG: efflux RND transporter periplasmic adaptor subunit [Prolixibacteraceae bacterium]